MAKTSGLGDQFYIAGYDLSGDLSSVDQISGGPAILDVTPINASANVRLGGQRAGDWQFTSFFDFTKTGQGAAVNALETLPNSDVVACYFRGNVVGNAAAGMTAKQLNFDPTRDTTGNLTLKVELMSNSYGYDWGVMLTPGLRTDTTGTTGTAFDNGAAGSNGAQAYLQIVSFTGTSVDVKVEHSTTSGGTYASLIDFGSQTGIGGTRATCTGTVDEFLKVVTSGTFSSAVFSVMINVNQTAVTF